eukprot:Clim_evm115s11 gene=Clim_evmTU115s11
MPDQGPLNKREYVAAICLQGILTNGKYHSNRNDAADYAVKFADALVKAIDMVEVTEDTGHPLSKREYVAALCLQGILANGKYHSNRVDAADYAIKFGDALIEQLQKHKVEA